jgi:alkanesulfonate monooxygenase SsuD/methylene tetrahydromethanopterin reductase-like flavin-dependent oxidoreductase (luciferase family)
MLRDIAQALDAGGMDYLTLATHLLSSPLDSMPGEPLHHFYGPFREPLTLFAYLSGLTERIVFRTSCMILPAYPTALVAKQAADISIMSGGRLELGVSISWNPREYQAMGQNFRNRGKRLEEQVVLLRRMWTEPFITFEGQYHHLDNLGLNQLPPRIPILLGVGTEDYLLRRAARLGDGWLPLADPVEPIQRLRRFLQEAGRDPSTFLIGGSLFIGDTGPREWVEKVGRLHAAGVTDIEIFPGRGLSGMAAAERLLEARNILLQEFG